MVKPKKHLGQHFLNDLEAAEKIVKGLTLHKNYKTVLEIGAGMGVLTQYLLKNANYETHVVEIDKESIVYLHKHFPELKDRIYAEDFLKANLNPTSTENLFGGNKAENFAIIGNLPYNISSQIFFKVLEHRQQIPEVVCMLQKEVALRIASPAGKKDYGILSVFLQAFYDIEYLFSVGPEAFTPPPKVNSGIIRLRRNDVQDLGCDEKKFFLVVKQGFNQRRKTLRNALKSIMNGKIIETPFLDKRAEQLSVKNFVELTNLIF